MYYSSKKLGHDRGYSCVFRQKDAVHSHCQYPHGYALGFEFTWRSPNLDECNWVFDFGGLSEFKKWLDYMFDHTYIIANDDPFKDKLIELENLDYMQARFVNRVGCEAFAELVFDKFNYYLKASRDGYSTRINDILMNPPKKLINPYVELYSVEVSEHEGNSAKYCIE